MTMRELIPVLGRIAGVKTPVRQLPAALLCALAAVQEVYARITGKPILLSMATLRLLMRERTAPVSITARVSESLSCVSGRWSKPSPTQWCGTVITVGLEHIRTRA